MIRNIETCKMAIRMAELEREVAEGIEATLPSGTLQGGSAPYERKQTAIAARLRASILEELAAEYCELSDSMTRTEINGVYSDV